MVSPYDKKPGPFQNVRQKVVLRGELRSKLGTRIHSRIDIPSQSFLGPRQRLHDVLKRRVTNNEQIQIAGRTQLAARSRPKDKCELNPLAERRQPISEQVRKACRFGKQALQLRKDGRLRVGSEIHLVTLYLPLQQTGGR
jgi:hypothetical protein